MECCELGFHLRESTTGALKKAALNLLENHGADGTPSSIWLPHRKGTRCPQETAVDAPEGQALLQQLGPAGGSVYLRIALAYEGNEARALAAELV